MKFRVGNTLPEGAAIVEAVKRGNNLFTISRIPTLIERLDKALGVEVHRVVEVRSFRHDLPCSGTKMRIPVGESYSPLRESSPPVVHKLLVLRYADFSKSTRLYYGNIDWPSECVMLMALVSFIE